MIGWPRLGFRKPCRHPARSRRSPHEIDRLIAAGIRSGTVLADAGYGLSAACRQGLSGRSLIWAVGIPRHPKVYPHDVELIFPVSGHGARPRQHPISNTLSVAAETMLAPANWKKISWRRGTKGRLTARFAALRIRIARRHTATHSRQGTAAHAGRGSLAGRRVAITTSENTTCPIYRQTPH